jgi:hypothetical protein
MVRLDAFGEKSLGDVPVTGRRRDMFVPQGLLAEGV